jgi:hypothetical protein
VWRRRSHVYASGHDGPQASGHRHGSNTRSGDDAAAHCCPEGDVSAKTNFGTKTSGDARANGGANTRGHRSAVHSLA